MLLLVLMLWSAGGAAAGSTAAAQAHLGSGNQLMQAERYAEAAEEFQQALREDSCSGASPRSARGLPFRASRLRASAAVARTDAHR